MLFIICYVAPFILRARYVTPNPLPDGAHESGECHGNPNPLIQKASAVLHILAFTPGVTAAYLGVSIGG